MEKKDFDNAEYYTNRELSWLEFNERVLQEAQDRSNPLFERLKFLAITCSNLDEFFMVRVSALWDQYEYGYTKKDFSGLSPREQLTKISEHVHKLETKKYNCYMRSLKPALEKEGISILPYDSLSKDMKKYARDYYNSMLYPILTPMAIDQSRRFPLLSNKSLNVLVQLDIEDDEDDEDEAKFAVVQVPSVLPRMLELPSTDGKLCFVLIEDIIKRNVDQLFQGHTVRSADVFRIMRNSDLEIDEEESEDLLIEIEKSIKRRKWGAPVRLEVDKAMEEENLAFLMTCLELEQSEVYETNGPLDLTFLFAASSINGFEHLKQEVLYAQKTVAFLKNEDMFEVIRNEDILAHHPYESFDCVLDFIRIAANDPQVLAIKQTLYRVSGNSPIIESLIQAAENGKQVTVLIELKARFDEENNISWAKKLEQAGCHVIYGLVGLKTHCKICLVVRKEDDGIKRYVHFGTGNYNEKTASIYTDLGFFTCREAFGSDTSALFNVLTGYSKAPAWKKLAVAPTTLRETFVTWIENEISFAKDGMPARIIAKVNSLADPDMIKVLYKASCAGVKIELIVRGICCLRPGIKGVSENITVISVVDRFLEHSRIYYFENGGANKIFLSSADWMPRNLDRRVEIAFPIEHDDLKKEIVNILETTLSDTVKARLCQPDGTYEKIDRRGKDHRHSQILFHKRAVEAVKKYEQEVAPEVFIPIKELF